VQINVPVHVGGATVATGDLIHGRNGVTTIPIEIAPRSLQACPSFMAADSVILDYLQVLARSMRKESPQRKRNAATATDKLARKL